MDPVLATAVFLFGLAFGSFLNVCIHRVPRRIERLDRAERLEAEAARLRAAGGEDAEFAGKIAAARALRAEAAGLSIVSPASACPRCRRPIRFYDNVPVLSWLILRGRCRDCGARISPRYLAVELLTALAFLACYARFDFSLLTLKFCVFSFLILGLIFTDAEWKLLPDAFTLAGLGIGLAFSLLAPVNDVVAQLLPGAFPVQATAVSWRLLSFADAVFGAAVGASFFYGVSVLYQRARGREGMGLGDVKLMAMVGAFLGVRLTVLTIFGASLVGSAFGIAAILTVWSKRTRRRMRRLRESAAIARRRAWHSARLVYRYYEMPFGVFLGGMAMVALFFGRALLDWYWGLYL
jgi:leader peptidase (prepilin peptidase)/N-methyltransferase